MIIKPAAWKPFKEGRGKILTPVERVAMESYNVLIQVFDAEVLDGDDQLALGELLERHRHVFRQYRTAEPEYHLSMKQERYAWVLRVYDEKQQCVEEQRVKFRLGSALTAVTRDKVITIEKELCKVYKTTKRSSEFFGPLKQKVGRTEFTNLRVPKL